MIKRINIFFYVLSLANTLIASTLYTNSKLITENILKEVCNSVVSIHSYYNRGNDVIEKIGTGFVYGRDGFIITQASIINGSDSVLVRFQNGIKKKAWKIYFNYQQKIAILYIDAEDLKSTVFSEELKFDTTKKLFIIGNSLGVFPSLTIANFIGFDAKLDIIKLDAIFPPGNSGSPVINDNGTVVGMLIGNIYKKDEGSFSVKNEGFALSSGKIKNIFSKIVDNLKMYKSWAGVSVTDLIGMDFGKGVLVVDTAPNGPVDIAGICKGDTIIEFQGIKVRDIKCLTDMVKKTKPNQKVVFTIKKGEMKINRIVKMEEAPWERKRTRR